MEVSGKFTPAMLRMEAIPPMEGLRRFYEPKAENQVVEPTFCEKLVSLAAHTKELETQAHLIHFNYQGSDFFGVHAFLKEQYELHLEQFDKIGEFVRAGHEAMPLCSVGLGEALICFLHVKPEAAKHGIEAYAVNLNGQATLAAAIEAAAVCERALDVADFMAQVVEKARHARWQILASGG